MKKTTHIANLPFIKNDIVELDIVDFGCDGEGIGKIGSVPIFIPLAIPGETVRAKIVSVKKNLAFGKLLTVLNKSPDRQRPPCPYYPQCGGCGLQHLSYRRQLEYKKSHIINTVKKTAGLDLPPFEVAPSSPAFGCRNKLSLPVRDTGGEIKIGFFKARTHDIVDIDDCLLQKGGCGELLCIFRKFMRDHNLSAYCEESHTGDIRHLCLRVLGDKTTVTVVGTLKNPEKIRPLGKILKTVYGANNCLYYNENTASNNVIFGSSFTRIEGDDQPVVIDGLSLKIHPAAFFQVNDSVREQLFDFVAAQAQETRAPTAIEAYAGQGILSCKLSPFFKRVIAVESFGESTKSGVETADANSIRNLSFITADCETALPPLLKAHPEAVLILDPPRAGLSEPVTNAVAESGIQTVLYISCNPATLARDLILLTKNYRVESLKAFDMFPQTANVETAMVLKIKN